MSEKNEMKEKNKTVSLSRTLSSLGRDNKFVDVPVDALPNSCFGKSLADETYFVPSSEMVKRVKQGASAVVGEYDFADGKDTGKSDMLFARRRGLDMAEVTQKLYQSQADLETAQRDFAVEVVKRVGEKLKQKHDDKVSMPKSSSAPTAGSSGSSE